MGERANKVHEALGLLNSMVACGEDHTDTSRKVIAEAREALAALEQVAKEAEALLDIIDMGETETGFDEESKELRQAIMALSALDGGADG